MKIWVILLRHQLLSMECNKRRGRRVKRPSCANTSPLHRRRFLSKKKHLKFPPKEKPGSWPQVGKVSQVEWIPLQQLLIELKRLSPQLFFSSFFLFFTGGYRRNYFFFFFSNFLLEVIFATIFFLFFAIFY